MELHKYWKFGSLVALLDPQKYSVKINFFDGLVIVIRPNISSGEAIKVLAIRNFSNFS